MIVYCTCTFTVKLGNCCEVRWWVSVPPFQAFSRVWLLKNTHFSCQLSYIITVSAPQSSSYFSEKCAVSSVPEPVLSSSLQMSVNEICLAIVNQPNLEVNSSTNYTALPGLFGWCAMLYWLAARIWAHVFPGGSFLHMWLDQLVIFEINTILSTHYTIFHCILWNWASFIHTVTVLFDITGHHEHSFYKCASKQDSDIPRSQLSFMECISCRPTRRHHNYQHFIQHQIGDSRDKYATKLITWDTDTQ